MRVGILGGGQLGQMLILSGLPLGISFRTWDKDPKAPCATLAPFDQGNFSDSSIAKRFAEDVDIITYESENIPVNLLEGLQSLKPIFPSIKALKISQDRVHEKTLFTKLKVRTPKFVPVDSFETLKTAADSLGFPSVLKTRRLGYDGKGQVVLKTEKDLEIAWKGLAGASLILEEFIPFDREVSLISVRDKKGKTLFYPLVENHHEKGILAWSKAPAPNGTKLTAEAQSIAKKLLKELDYVGVLVIEFFVLKGKLFINEMAPRVHNSGHWTIEGAVTSQFENHLRAILGLPLGATELIMPSAMLNLIGAVPPANELLANANAHLHLYGKEARPGRKLGHITFCEETEKVLEKKLKQWKGKTVILGS